MTNRVDWGDLLTEGGEIAVLVAITALIYRSLRLKYPDVPEAVMQIIAAILATAFNLAILWRPDVVMHQWITIGIARGVLRSQNIIKSMDWAVSAATKTGAPEAGIPEKPPAWFAAAQAQGTTVQSPTLPEVRSPVALRAQIRTNEAAAAKAAERIGTPKDDV